MFAPALTQELFDECVKEGLSIHKAISKLNSKNCKKDFSKTIPKALRESDFNAYLIIKNHKERWKYMGLKVENVAGALHILECPEIVWTGYVSFGKEWYAVDSHHILERRIPASSKIIFPQIEFDEDEDDDDTDS